MNRTEADAIAQAYVAQQEGKEPLAVRFDLTTEHDCGWLYSFNAVRYWETMDFMDMLVGHGPVLVPRDGSEVVMFPSFQSAEMSLDDYRAGLPFGETRERSKPPRVRGPGKKRP